MNIFHRVTLATLRKNKVRTAVTVIGIILSAAMICAVTTFASSIQNYALDNAIYESGDWQGSATLVSFDTVQQIAASDKVETAVYDRYLGYAALVKPDNVYKPYLYFLGIGEGYENTVAIHVTAGEYPQTSDEILLPEHLLTRENCGWHIGDTLTFDLCDRMMLGAEEEMLMQNNPAYGYDEEGNEIFNVEELVLRETRTFTVVGFYERPAFEDYSAPGYTVLTRDDGTGGTDGIYSSFFKMKKTSELYDFMEANRLNGETNRDVLMYSGISRYSSFYTVLYSVAAIVIGLIMFGSVSLIYNAFSISVSERTRQFGLLSSVGATRKQLRQSVLFEAFAVSVIGIPVGILGGIGGIAVTLLFIGNKFSGLIGWELPLRVCVSPASVIVAIVVTLITVLISAWLPSRRATRVSAVEAIRQNGDVRMEKHPRQTAPWVYKLFGLPVVLANKYYRRNRKKYRATVLSLFMSVVLFISASALSDYLVESVERSLEGNGYDVSLMVPSTRMEGISADEMLAQLSARKAVTKATYSKDFTVYGYAPVKDLTEDCLQVGDVGPNYYESRNGMQVVELSVMFVNDADFRDLLKQNRLKEQDYFNPDAPLGVAMDGYMAFDRNTERYEEITYLKSPDTEITVPVPKLIEGYTYAGSSWGMGKDSYVCHYRNNEDADDVLEFSYDEIMVDYTLKTGAAVYEKPYYWDYIGRPGILYPYSMLEHVCPDWAESARGEYVEYRFCSSDHTATYNDLKLYATENGISSIYLDDYAASVEQERNMVTIVQVFSGGFIVLISLIAAANVFNTISTNISLRRREFAMLKSVGMTRKGFNRMMGFECLLYGTRSLLFGLPVSVVVTFLIWASVSNGVSTNFHIPWVAIGIAVLSVFAVVFISMMYAMGKIKRDNPIDALKNENL